MGIVEINQRAKMPHFMQATILAVCMVAASALPLENLGSFIEISPQDHGAQLMQAISELKRRQEQVADEADKKLNIESEKSQKIDQDGKKSARRFEDSNCGHGAEVAGHREK